MSILTRLLARLRLWAQPRPAAPDPERLALRDWADLPAHHPGPPQCC